MTTTTNMSRTRLRTGSALRTLALLGAGLTLSAGFVAPAFAQEATPQSDQTTPAPGTNTTSPSTAPLGQTPTAPATPGAGQEAATSSQDIIVTGSLIRNPAAASASPLVTLSATDLAQRGINTVAEAIQQVSANNAGALATNWSAFGFPTGASAPSLRGLNDAYTLTLFNNLRSAVYPLADDTSRNFVDLNTIPDSIVDHIDVLQDGASATYGSDAIAGVVNVIIKKQITGVHLNASGGVSDHGDLGEQRLDATYGYGKLDEQGFNIWINGEYQHDDALYVRQRGFPFNTADLSSICGSSIGSTDPKTGAVIVAKGTRVCMNNGIVNGVQADGRFNFGSTFVPMVAPYDPAAGDVGRFRFLNPAAGCMGLPSYTLTPTQFAAKATNPVTACQEDRLQRFNEYDPDIKRIGGNARLTVNIGSRAQAYAMFNFYESKTFNTGSDQIFANSTTPVGQTPGGTPVSLSPLILPVYVCPRGTVTCTAANGTLNPNNPFAAAGEEADLRLRYDLPTTTATDARTFRGSAGISGSFGSDWNYDVDFTTSRVLLGITQTNNMNARHLLDVIADGSYNFVDQSANSQAERDYLAPVNHVDNSSSLTQIQASLSKAFFDLPGGALQVAIGAAYRKESVNEPSANPANETDPYDRYFAINAVSVIGGRNVKSAYFEVDAPILNSLDLKAQGRYDDYSTGQKNFSPKFEASFQPIHAIKIRGTFSKGFRAPSLAQAFALPSTGYVNISLDASDPAQAAYIAAHQKDAYVSGTYGVGLTASGNPNVNPEHSTQWTAGIVFQPTRHLTVTADYYHLKVKDLIGAPSQCQNTAGIASAYYTNNGVVNIPGCTIIKAPLADPQFPNLLPELGYIAYSYANSGSETVSGIDLSATLTIPLGNRVTLTSSGTASYIAKLEQTLADGTKLRFDGSLSPCNITSCSGTPKWRATWENTLDFGGATLSATANYTSGYQLESTDFGGTIGDCEGSIGASIVPYSDNVTPVACSARRFIDVDLTGTVKVADHFQLYMNVLNVLGAKAPFDPSAAYSLYQFNPAWADQGFIGRYFRVGAKVDF